MRPNDCLNKPKLARSLLLTNSEPRRRDFELYEATMQRRSSTILTLPNTTK